MSTETELPPPETPLSIYKQPPVESKPPPPITTVLREKLHERHEDLRARAAAVRALQDWVQLNASTLTIINEMDIPPSIFQGCTGDKFLVSLDFDYLTHEEVMKVIQMFPGRWDKEPSDDKIHYTLQLGQKMQLRCYAGQPPPNCQIVETEEDVPAVPATKRKVKKLVCK